MRGLAKLAVYEILIFPIVSPQDNTLRKKQRVWLLRYHTSLFSLLMFCLTSSVSRSRLQTCNWSEKGCKKRRVTHPDFVLCLILSGKAYSYHSINRAAFRHFTCILSLCLALFHIKLKCAIIVLNSIHDSDSKTKGCYMILNICNQITDIWTKEGEYFTWGWGLED